MIVVLSGEGPSDLGQCGQGQGECRFPEFVVGPMTLVIDRMIGERLGYRPLELDPESYVYVGEQRLQELATRRREERRNFAFVGKKREQETGYFYINAWMFGEETIRHEKAADNEPAMGVLFRDSDGTRSSVDGIWEAKLESMIGGFERSGLGNRGVPMIPKPKSEAWLLCAARPQPYVNCAPLEQRSGNDNSPHSLKRELSQVLQGDVSSQDQVDWLNAHGFDHAAVAAQMTSFARFSDHLNTALTTLGVAHA